MTDDDFLEAQRKARAESVAYVGAANKSERERWVVRRFLTNLGVNHAQTEVVEGEDPPDVQFRDASFEIKEVLDPGRRRHQEYKEALGEAIRATKPRDLVKLAPFNEITISRVYELILESAKELARNKYAFDLRQRLDLLFYVNLLNTHEFIETPFPSVSALSSLGWKSVSFVKGYRSCVLVARNDAPVFLKSNISRIVHRDLEHDAASDL